MVEQLDMLGGVAAGAPTKIVLDAQAAWNDYAVRFKWRECKVLDRALRASIARAVEDYGGLVGFRASLAKVAKNRFVQGMVAPTTGHKQFKANIVWFCRAQTIRNVVEDFYEDEGADVRALHGSIAGQSAPDDVWGKWLRDYKAAGFWPSQLGPRPEEPGCRAPASMVEACLKRLGIVKRIVVVETKERRLEAMIVSYRSNHYYDRANALEEELAKLQARPPVLVPAPDARDPDVVPDAPKPGKFWQPPSRADAMTRRMHAREAAQDVPLAEYESVPEGEQYEDT